LLRAAVAHYPSGRIAHESDRDQVRAVLSLRHMSNQAIWASASGRAAYYRAERLGESLMAASILPRKSLRAEPPLIQRTTATISIWIGKTILLRLSAGSAAALPSTIS